MRHPSAIRNFVPLQPFKRKKDRAHWPACCYPALVSLVVAWPGWRES